MTDGAICQTCYRKIGHEEEVFSAWDDSDMCGECYSRARPKRDAGEHDFYMQSGVATCIHCGQAFGEVAGPCYAYEGNRHD